MAVRLNITMDEDLYRRLKKELPPKGISSFIEKAVRARIRPDRRALDEAYRAASKERWRRSLEREWRTTETEG
jgi:predicted CopG family antitoxin